MRMRSALPFIALLVFVGCKEDEVVPPAEPVVEYRALKVRVVSDGTYRLRVNAVLGTRVAYTLDSPESGTTEIEFNAPRGGTVTAVVADANEPCTLDLVMGEEVVASGTLAGDQYTVEHTVP